VREDRELKKPKTDQKRKEKNFKEGTNERGNENINFWNERR
jgi:hypothetical protein